MVSAGEPMADLASDFDANAKVIEDAVRCELDRAAGAGATGTPAAYMNIDAVMAAKRDVAEIVHSVSMWCV